MHFLPEKLTSGGTNYTNIYFFLPGHWGGGHGPPGPPLATPLTPSSRFIGQARVGGNLSGHDRLERREMSHDCDSDDERLKGTYSSLWIDP